MDSRQLLRELHLSLLVTNKVIHWVVGQIKNEVFGTDLHPSSLPLGAYTSLQVPVPTPVWSCSSPFWFSHSQCSKCPWHLPQCFLQYFIVTNKRSIYENCDKIIIFDSKGCLKNTSYWWSDTKEVEVVVQTGCWGMLLHISMAGCWWDLGAMTSNVHLLKYLITEFLHDINQETYFCIS